MPLTKEQLRKCLAGARNVIQKESESEQRFTKAGNQQVLEQSNIRGYNPSGVEYVNTDDELVYESPYEVGDSYEYEEGLELPSDMQTASKNSRMPEAIKQSMMKEQIDVSALQSDGSVLDSIGLKGIRRGQRSQINEANRQASPAGINYNLIKQIISECLDERLGDGTLKTIQVGDGKIRLVDNQGRIFVANLEYKGNVSDKKKK